MSSPMARADLITLRAAYQENMPSQAFQGDYPQTNYLNTSSDMPCKPLRFS